MPRMPWPDQSCYLCDGTQCRILRILNNAWYGTLCDGADKGKEKCKIFNNANKEGLMLFFK